MEIPGLFSKRELAEALGISDFKLDTILVQLAITGQRRNNDARKVYFTQEELQKIRDWLAQPLSQA